MSLVYYSQLTSCGNSVLLMEIHLFQGNPNTSSYKPGANRIYVFLRACVLYIMLLYTKYKILANAIL